jgi:hypothetical protein
MSQIRARRSGALFLLLGGVLASASCGDVSRDGRSPAFLVIDSLTASSGTTGEFSHVLGSDVLTCGGVIEDPGQATVRILLRDQGNPGATPGPSNLNLLKISRYRVMYKRADGHNVEGVDVPYSFDGAITATITNSPSTVGFTIVRAQAKFEAPLMALRQLGGSFLISTIADITFYGEDLAGNGFATSGTMSINFADWADPSCEGAGDAE